MKTRYLVRGYSAFSESDSFDHGCDTRSTRHEFDTVIEFSQPTLGELLLLIAGQFCADAKKDFLIDSCDENGRLDLQVYQTSPFKIAKVSPKVDEQFRKGERPLWLTCYSFIVHRMDSEFSLTEQLRLDGVNVDSDGIIRP